MFPVYDSRHTLCREPVGAIPRGSDVTFRVYPESHRFPLRAYLVVERETTGVFDADGRTELEVHEYAMAHVDSGRDVGDNEHTDEREVFECTLTPDFVGIARYHFRFENDGGCFYYGAREGRTGDVAEFYGTAMPPEFQLTVYQPRDVPDWFGRGVTYQIFPDRFARSRELHIYTPLADGSTPDSRERIVKHWGDEPNPFAEPFDGRMEVTNRDFFGGDLRGIVGKLDYLKELGVTTLYLNPIFESFSNHRYNTADYEKIDPMLGSADDFRNLCREAHARGMRVMLDGVFNHTGSDSVYFNRRGRYPSLGAYQSQQSPYYSWFDFKRWPDDYSSWWGIDTLPAVNENDPSYREFIKNNVVAHWLSEGADGWRLDVADELPDDFIREISSAARAAKPDAFVLGEVWEDASNKISYSVRRKYILDGGLDAVMGYVFRGAVIDFVRGGAAENFRDAMLDLMENYPPYATFNSMNILGTHDTPRILTLLGASPDAFAGPKETHGDIACLPELRDEAVSKLKIASALQFFLPGSPTVYYGDEVGMEGAEDPFCRRTHPWAHPDDVILPWYKLLGRARRELAALTDGDTEFIHANGCTMTIRRTLRRNVSALDDKQAPNGAISVRQNEVLLVCNISHELQQAVVSDHPVVNSAGFSEYFDDAALPRSVYRDFVTGELVDLSFGTLDVAPLSVRILVKL